MQRICRDIAAVMDVALLRHRVLASARVPELAVARHRYRPLERLLLHRLLSGVCDGSSSHYQDLQAAELGEPTIEQTPPAPHCAI
jgi:hypothetical protein